jgi:hypothetical protein
MARGRQPSSEQLMEELRMEIRATAYDLMDHDRWELEALRAARELSRAALGAILAGRVSLAVNHLRDLEAVLSEHQARDLHENRQHRHVAAVARDGVA